MPYTKKNPSLLNQYTDTNLFQAFDEGIADAHDYFLGTYNVKEYGALGTGSGGAGADQAGFAAAISAAGASGIVFIPPGDYYVAGGFEIGSGVKIIGAGVGRCTVNHTGNNVLYALYGGNGNNTLSFKNFQVNGNSGAAAEAFETEDANHTVYEDLLVQNYSAGKAFVTMTADPNNGSESSSWTRVKVRGCLTGWQFYVPAGGNSSFSDNRWIACQCVQSVPNSTAILLNQSAYIYASTLDIKIMNERSTCVAIKLDNNAQISQSHFNVLVEGYTSTDPTAGIGLQTANGTIISGTGNIYLYADPGDLVNSIDANSKIALDLRIPGAVQTLTAPSQINLDSKLLQVSAASAITLSSAPTVRDGVEGQVIRIINTGANNITLQDQATLPLSNLRLTAATVVLTPRDSIELTYVPAVGDWVQTASVVAVL